jgi:hypothetical protein
MTRISINVVGGNDREEIVIDVPEWDDLTAEDQEILVAEAAAPAVERMEPTVYHFEMAN